MNPVHQQAGIFFEYLVKVLELIEPIINGENNLDPASSNTIIL